MTTVSVITTSPCAISFWFAWSTNSTCTDWAFLTLRATTNKDKPSSTVEIHIHIPAHVLDSLLGTQIITMANTNNSHHNHSIAHRDGWVSLLVKANTTNIAHLINAHKAKIQIIIVHTSWDHEKISQNQISVSKNPTIHKNHIDETFLFLKALIIADIHVITRKNHRIISINFRNMAGEQIVMIQKITIITDNDPIWKCTLYLWR